MRGLLALGGCIENMLREVHILCPDYGLLCLPINWYVFCLSFHRPVSLRHMFYSLWLRDSCLGLLDINSPSLFFYCMIFLITLYPTHHIEDHHVVSKALLSVSG